MTKVNENGQLEWTFEELDLTGAIKQLNVEIDKNLTAREVIAQLWGKDTSSEVHEFYRHISDKLADDFKRLFVVRDNLIHLKNYEVKKNV